LLFKRLRFLAKREPGYLITTVKLIRMFKKLINIGVSLDNDPSLNRKIRICNVVALIAGISMLGYWPANYFYFNSRPIAFFDLSLLIVSCLTFYLHAQKRHRAAFYTFCIGGSLFFAGCTILYGLPTKTNYFQLMMCLIAIALFETKLELRIYLTCTTLLFFAVHIYMTGRPGYLTFTKEMIESEQMVGLTNLFLLFTTTLLFFIVFRNDNIAFQKEIINQKEIIEKQRQESIDSINYAERIQYALLPGKTMLDKNLSEHFVLFKPKDIVSGDFYWAAQKNNTFYLAVCDSTGHGVPGAFISLLNIRFLNEALYAKNLSAPNEIFNYIRKQLIDKMDGRNDGMDAILLKIEQTGPTQKIEYAAANNHPLLIRDNKIIPLPKDKMPVGKGERTESFTLQAFDMKKGDTLYLFTDGYADQFGGPKGKKFKYKQLESLLAANNGKPLSEQTKILDKAIIDWKGDLEQVDDILLMGIKI